MAGKDKLGRRTPRALRVGDLDARVDVVDGFGDAVVRGNEVARLERRRSATAENGSLCVATDNRNFLQTLFLQGCAWSAMQ